MRLESLTLKECLDFSSYLNKSEVKPCIGWFSANAGDIRDMGSIPGSGKSPRGWQPTPVFLPGESRNRGTRWATVHRVAKSQTRLSDFTLTFHFHALEKEMATHSSVLAWRIPGTVEPGGLPPMGSHRVGHY